MTNATKELNKYIDQLTDDEKEQLAKELKKHLLIAQAQRASSFKPRVAIPVSEIVKEVRIVRKNRHADKSRT